MTDPDLDDAYGLKTPEDSRRLYAGWAETYDDSFARSMDFALPRIVATIYAAHGGVGPVLDAGAGTGLVGQELAARGVGPVDGLDISAQMLGVARRKGAYRTLIEGDLTGRLEIGDAAYDGVVSSGTFTLGHVGPEALDELLRVAAPDALFVLAINAAHYRSAGFAAKFVALGDGVQGLQLEDHPIYGPGANGAHGKDRAQVAVFRKG